MEPAVANLADMGSEIDTSVPEQLRLIHAALEAINRRLQHIATDAALIEEHLDDKPDATRSLPARMGRVEVRLEEIFERIDSIDVRLEGIERAAPRPDNDRAHERALEEIVEREASIEVRLDQIANHVAAILRWLELADGA